MKIENNCINVKNQNLGEYQEHLLKISLWIESIKVIK